MTEADHDLSRLLPQPGAPADGLARLHSRAAARRRNRRMFAGSLCIAALVVIGVSVNTFHAGTRTKLDLAAPASTTTTASTAPSPGMGQTTTTFAVANQWVGTQWVELPAGIYDDRHIATTLDNGTQARIDEVHDSSQSYFWSSVAIGQQNGLTLWNVESSLALGSMNPTVCFGTCQSQSSNNSTTVAVLEDGHATQAWSFQTSTGTLEEVDPTQWHS